MSSILKFNQAIKIKSYADDTAAEAAIGPLENGVIYYNTTDNKMRVYENGAWQDKQDVLAEGPFVDGDKTKLDGIETGATADQAWGDITGTLSSQTDLQSALDAKLDDSQLIDSDDFTGATATNINSAEATKAYIDAQIALGSDDQTAAEVSYSNTTSGLTATDVQAALDEIEGRVDTNDAKVSADGSVTSHSDVTNAGSGAIITSGERSDLNANTAARHDAATLNAGGTTQETLSLTGQEITVNLATTTTDGAMSASDKTKMDGIEVGADVTDTANVDAAGATMNTDTDVSNNSWVLDEDNMASDDATKVPTQQSVKAYADTKIAATEKGSVNGVASLDGSGKVPVSQLPSAIMTYEGVWDANTNTPTLADGTGDAGQVYRVTVAGTQDLGSGNITFNVGDYAIHNGTEWEKSDTTDAVDSVNGQTGTVTLDADDIDDTSTAHKFVTASDITNLGNLSGANSGDEVSATDSVEGIVELATQGEVDTGTDTTRVITPATLAGSTLQATADSALQNLSDDTTPSLGGDLTLGDNTIIHDANGMQRGTSSSDFLEEEYVHSITLTASSTDATDATALQFATASFEGMMVDYKIKEATTNRVRIGQLLVATNGTDVSISDTFSETNNVGVEWTADINTGNVRLKYTTTANNKTMRCDLKRIKV